MEEGCGARMTAPFSDLELKTELEHALGFTISSFKPLICVNSVNYKATRADDGFMFTVKGLPESRKTGYDLIVTHLRELEGTKAPERVFQAECPSEYRGFHLLCLKWCEGRGVYPDRLTEEQLAGFLDDYSNLVERLESATHVVPAYPTMKWRNEALAACRGIAGRWLKRRIDAIPEKMSAFRPDRLQVTHGDLHPGNIAFKDGVVTGFLDVEGLTYGYPAWDIVRYFNFALTKLPFWAFVRRHRTWRRFAFAVGYLPYSREEWEVSINATIFEQMWKKNTRGKFRFGDILKLAARLRQFDKMKRLCAAG